MMIRDTMIHDITLALELENINVRKRLIKRSKKIAPVLVAIPVVVFLNSVIFSMLIAFIMGYYMTEVTSLLLRGLNTIKELDEEGAKIATVADILIRAGTNNENILYILSSMGRMTSRVVRRGYKEFANSNVPVSFSEVLDSELERLPSRCLVRWVLKNLLISRREGMPLSYPLSKIARMEIVSRYRSSQHLLDTEITVAVFAAVFIPLMYCIALSPFSVVDKLPILLFLLMMSRVVSLILPERNNSRDDIEDKSIEELKKISTCLLVGKNLEYSIYEHNIVNANNMLDGILELMCSRDSTMTGKVIMETLPFMEELLAVKKEIKSMIESQYFKARMLLPTLSFVVGTLSVLWPFILKVEQMLESQYIVREIPFMDIIVTLMLILTYSSIIAKRTSSKLPLMIIIALLYSLGVIFAVRMLKFY